MPTMRPPDAEWQRLISTLHASGRKAALAITGGGSGAIGELLRVPGGSRLLIEAQVPYDAQALATFHKVDDEAFRLYGLSMAEYTLGNTKESQRALEELTEKHEQEAAYQIAEAHAWRGEKDEAFEWLDRAYQQRDGGLSDIKVNLLIASLHGDPRFQALVQKMNLPP